MALRWSVGSVIVYAFLTIYFYFSLSKLSKWKTNQIRNESEYRRRSGIRIFLLSLVPTFFAVYRYISYPIGGTDAAWYIRAYQNITWIPINGYALFGDQDLLFNNFMYLIHKISPDYHFYFLIIYLFMAMVIFYFVYQTFDEVICFSPLIYLIYFYLQSYNIIRFMVATSIMLCAFVTLSKEKRLLSLIFSILAVLTHSALILALISIAVYILLKRFADKKGWVIAGVLVAYVMFFVLQNRIVSYFVSTTYRAYTERGQSLIGQVMPILCMILCAVFYRELVEGYKANKFMLYLVFFDAASIPIAMNLGYSRVHTVFLLPRLYMWGILIDLIGKKIRLKKLTFQLSYIVSIIWTIFRFSRDWYTAGWMPYILDLFR